MIKITHKYIIGADEAGTGAAAGPAAICAVKAPVNWSLAGLRDSKKLSENQRLTLEKQLLILAKQNIIQFHLILKSNKDIDTDGLAACLDDGFGEAIDQLYTPDAFVILDGTRKVKDLDTITNHNNQYVIGADNAFPQVMAAAILAKCARDKVILQLAKKHPEYGWDTNRGYLRADHITALKKYGFSPYHRTSYKIKGVNK